MTMKTEIMPLYTNVMILPYASNPYAALVTKSGLKLTEGEFDSQDSGEHEVLDSFIKCAEVIEVGPDTKYVKVGDDVFYDTRSARPVPFLRQGFWNIAEQNLVSIMSDNLTIRFKNERI
jgi:hypothetical protein